jgi:hypothetical protein
MTLRINKHRGYVDAILIFRIILSKSKLIQLLKHFNIVGNTTMSLLVSGEVMRGDDTSRGLVNLGISAWLKILKWVVTVFITHIHVSLDPYRIMYVTQEFSEFSYIPPRCLTLN